RCRTSRVAMDSRSVPEGLPADHFADERLDSGVDRWAADEGPALPIRVPRGALPASAARRVRVNYPAAERTRRTGWPAVTPGGGGEGTSGGAAAANERDHDDLYPTRALAII